MHSSLCYAYVFWQHLDFWSEPSSFTDTIFLRVSPQQSALVDKLLNDAGISHDVVVSDLQRSVRVVREIAMSCLNIVKKAGSESAELGFSPCPPTTGCFKK